MCHFAGGRVITAIVVVIAVAIKLTSPGPIFYGHIRYGRGGKPFVAWKFRTMVANASTLLEWHLQRSLAFAQSGTGTIS